MLAARAFYSPLRDRPKAIFLASAEAESGRMCNFRIRPKPNISRSYLSQLRPKPKVAEAEFIFILDLSSDARQAAWAVDQRGRAEWTHGMWMGAGRAEDQAAVVTTHSISAPASPLIDTTCNLITLQAVAEACRLNKRIFVYIRL